jgi:rhodanese-related sulfurtransferase
MNNLNSNGAKPRSLVLEYDPADPAVALAYFESKMGFGTDPSDVHADIENGVTGFIVVDARSAENYAKGHVPGAINFPHRQMTETSVTVLPKDRLIVVYCDGTGCNGSTKAAVKLTSFGFRVKEMIGGIDWWKRDGYAVHTSENIEAAATANPQAEQIACGC